MPEGNTVTNKVDSLDRILGSGVAEIKQLITASTAAAASSVIAEVIRCLGVAMQGIDEKNRESVDTLAAVLMSGADLANLEAAIKVLAEASFYYSRIGRAFDGIPLGRAARQMAVANGLKNLERFAEIALGAVYADASCFEEACQALERALVIARELQDPVLECAAMTNTASLLRDMGLYADALEVTDRALSFDRDSPRGRYLSLANAIHGLFSAHRLRDDAAALKYMKIGSDVLDDNPLADVVQKACFEYFRAMYLLSTDDHETAEVLIGAAKQRMGDVRNTRVHILLDIASALCDWASREPARELRARKELAELYHRSKQSRIHHDDVLRALIEVHKRTLTGETTGIEDRYGRDEVGQSLDALTRIITTTAKTGIEYAKELVRFNTGPSRQSDASREVMQYVGGVKNAKFYRQIRDRTERRMNDVGHEPAAGFDPFSGVRAWLGDGQAPAVIADIGNPGIVAKAPVDPDNAVRKHDELAAIHGDMAQLRVDSLRAAMRTAAYDVAENWALAAEFFDDQTGEHCFRVGRLAGLLAAEIGIDAENCLRIEHAARLHDIGKIAVNELILLKPGPLDSHEIVAMRAHTEVGSQLLENSTDATLQMAAAIAKYHHAWWNGAGYPNVAGEHIPLAARICAYADVYDALTNERPYKRAWPHKLAVEQMLCESGAHFDPRLMQPFLKVLERHVGSNASMPSTRLHLQDMEANGLLTSRRRLMSTVQAA